MRAEDFSAWLSAIAGLSADQRREALQAVTKASSAETRLRAGRLAEASLKNRGRRGHRDDALGTASHERVESRGCPHCAGREIIGWGRSHGLLRFRCKSCGRTFNALTKTPMAHLRKKEKWLDHARAMIEGKSLAKTAELCGVHPTTAFRWRHRFLRSPATDKPRIAERHRRGRRDLHPRILQGPMVRSAAKAAKAGRNGQTSGPPPGQHSRSRRPRPEGRDLRRRPASSRQRFGRRRARRRRHADNHLIGDGGRAIAAFARKAGFPPRRAVAGKADRRGASPAHQ